MTDITITGKVAERLQQIANDTHRTVEEVLEDVLATYPQGEAEDTSAVEPPLGSLARMAWAAIQNPIEVEATDVAQRSRDILRNEYAHHLLKHRALSDDTTDE